MLEEGVEDIESEPVDAAIQPTPDHLPLGGLDRILAPVEVRLLRQERVEVELPAAGLPLPAGPPKNDSQLLGGSGARVGVEA